MNKRITNISFITLIITSYAPSSSAAIKCWQNDSDTRECSFTVPQKYIGREIKILNGQGQVIKIIPAEKTPEEKKQAAEKAKIEAEKKRIMQEQRRKDRILVNTFLSVDDIILSRDTKLTAIDAIINITENNRAKQQKILDKHTNIAGNYERKSRQVPKKLLEDIKSSKAKIKDYDDFIEARKQEKLVITKKYDVDIARFKELKALKPH